jgi:hypothetical protein
MRQKFFFTVGALAIVITLLSLGPVPLAGQAPGGGTQNATAAAGKQTAARTSWGEPDLQGIWSGETLTPLERPARFKDKPVLSEKEAADLTAQILARPGRDQRAERGTEKDVAGAYNAVWQAQADSLADRRTSLIIDPPDGRIPPMTPNAQRRDQQRRELLASLLQGTSGGRPGPPSPRRSEVPVLYNVDRMNRADGPEDRSLAERCLGGMVPDFTAFYRIVQAPGSLTIFYDTGQGQGFHRIIPTNGSPHLPATIRQWWGDARGRWEGTSLVVDTTNFTPRTDYSGARENLHLVERFTRVDANRLNYEVTIDDPTTFTRRWTVAVPWFKESEQENRLFEPTCHVGNYGLVGMLANTRFAEKAFAEGKGPDPATMDIATGGGPGAIE